jgi:eukaryotic-like serine/threonine-protein kinase
MSPQSSMGPTPLALLLRDQRQRWQRGERVLVESYLEQHPALCEDAESALDLIYQELVLREEQGETPRAEEFISRFPQFAAELALQFEVDQEIRPGLTTRSVRTRPRPAAPLPDRIAVYEILGELGRGGMGVVYKARDDRLGRPVALKFLHPADSRDPEALARFFQEARTASALNHPHICTIYDVGEHAGQPFIVMEWIEGQTLRPLIGQGLSAQALARLMRQAAQALRTAHAAGIVHRDIKPENIMVRGDGYLKVLDFGLARLMPGEGRAGAPVRTAAAGESLLAGTPRYMAPEQLLGKEVTGAADIFALGIVLYELATGRDPFEPNAPEPVVGVGPHRVAAPRQLNPTIPASLDGLVLKMLAREAALRPTAAQVQAALEELGDSTVPGPAAMAGDDREAGAGLGETKPLSPPPEPGRRWRALVVLGVLLLLLAGSLFFFSRPGEVWRGAGVTPEAGLTPAPPAAAAPFGAARAREHQQRWADFLEQDVVERNGLGMDMVLIPPGSFTMGTTDENALRLRPLLQPLRLPLRPPVELPPHRVALTRPFRLGAEEVVLRLFRQFVDSTGHRTAAETSPGLGSGLVEGRMVSRPEFNFRHIGVQQRDNDPVVNVSFEDALAFCRWLSKNEGRTYRLPTEAEWEYACRAGTETLWSFGDDPAEGDEFEWVNTNSGLRPNLVGQKLPNPFGLRDMHGNVYELCADWFDPAYYSQSPPEDPRGPPLGKNRAVRGGCFRVSYVNTRSAHRSPTTGPGVAIGFRVVCEVDATK